jgi:tRNA(Met) C34 N-acetyltransferase TmcA
MRDAGFAPDPWQEKLLQSDAQRALLLCARQVGKSTATSIRALKTALTQPGSTTVIVAPVEEQSKELLRKVLAAFNNIGRRIRVVREAITFF